MTSPASILGHALLAVAISGALVGVYHHRIVQPMQRIGVVDVGAVYRLKEEQFSKLLTNASSEADKEKALAMAREFSKQLPKALDALPTECNCVVFLKSALAGAPVQTVDLTVHLKTKLDNP